MLKNVTITDRLREFGIRENHRGYPKRAIRVFGGDTETVRGLLHTFQLSSQGEKILQYSDPKNGFKDLCAWIDARALDDGLNLVFFHNLKFDITVLLYGDHQTLYDQYNEISLTRDGYVIRMFYGRVNCATIRKDLGDYTCPGCGKVPPQGIKIFGDRPYCANPNHGEPTLVKKNLGPVIRWLDSSAFCPPGGKSLASALKIYGVPYTKLPPPQGLGEKYLRGPVFEKYAMNDAIAEESLGEAILALHKKYDIAPCISLPQMAGKILRHHFFNPKETFPFPPEECRLAAELSYHAGKNGFYVKRGVYENVYEYDINSAFPKAMLEMPQLVKGRYSHVRKYVPRAMGIYRISGRRHQSEKFPIVFDAAFRPVSGAFKNEWVTGYEVACLKRTRGYLYRVHEGWVWKANPRHRHSPLAEFVKQFWDLKSKAPKGPERDTYKNILNSLYGKFAACVEKHNLVETAEGTLGYSEGAPKEFTSGALYHPFIATQITGYVRAELWRLECAGNALHAATDSIKSFADLPTSNDLGGVKKEVYGRCYLFRNKLYLHFAKDTSLCGHDLKKGWLYLRHDEMAELPVVGVQEKTGRAYDPDADVWRGKLFEPDGQHLCKMGLHGFKGSAFLLYRNRNDLLRTGVLDYSYDHMTQLREGYKRGMAVCSMIRKEERLVLSKHLASDA